MFSIIFLRDVIHSILIYFIFTHYDDLIVICNKQYFCIEGCQDNIWKISPDSVTSSQALDVLTNHIDHSSDQSHCIMIRELAPVYLLKVTEPFMGIFEKGIPLFTYSEQYCWRTPAGGYSQNSLFHRFAGIANTANYGVGEI